MPTTDRREALTEERALARAAERAFAGAGMGPSLGRIGLEPEFFPIRVDGAGRPAGRARLQGAGGVIDTIDELAASDRRVCPRHGPPMGAWAFELCRGGRLTFEPGGQIEHSTAVHSTVLEALADLTEVLGILRRGFARRDVVIAALGTDLWHPVSDVPQQLRAGRYTAMDRYYELRGPWGSVMMRNTASLQINLDFGPDGVWQQRWLLSNLLSPLMIATFASSPGEGVASLRARAWQELDPTRTGFPEALRRGDASDPPAAYAASVLSADVMLVRAVDGSYEPGQPGWSFGDWVRDGHPVHGWPTEDDLDYHLTTLFLEVRPRGFLELRAGEALPDRWRPALVALVSALLYDDRAREQALSALDGWSPRLDELWRRAAVEGIRDPELARAASRVWPDALNGAGRLPKGFLGEESIAAARRYLETFTERGRMPADQLLELQQDDPAKALEWAST